MESKGVEQDIAVTSCDTVLILKICITLDSRLNINKIANYLHKG